MIGGGSKGRPEGPPPQGSSKLERLGKYEILEELGRGAMGVVYKARDPLIGRLVAMKTITSGLAEQPEMLERFYREAQAAGGLQHPNIVTIYDLGKEGNTPYIAMEFLEGISLEKVIEERHPIPLAQRISYILDVCRALDYAHRRGVVHRDIKPANIVITTDGTIKVVDFGIARLVDTSRSQTGLLIGTVNYMSPEQVRGERVDGRSDIFSVGVMFYELLTGQRPFTGTNFTAVMLAIITSEPKPIRELVPEVPAEIETVIGKILRKDANERYQALEEVLLDIEPVFRKMQQETVTVMVSESQQLIEKKELEKARDVLRQALLIDTSNRQAKTLLEKVNAELRRSLVVPKLKEMVDHATELLKQGKLNEARAEAEGALKLDTAFGPAKELLKKVQEEVQRQEMVREWLTTTRQRLAEGNLTAAEQQLDKLLELQAGHPDAQKLKKQIAEEKDRRERRQRFLDTMAQARSLWTGQKFDECIHLLEGLKKDFPGEPEVEKLIDTVRADKEELVKHEKMTEARRLLGEQKFGEAVTVLDALLERHPNETAIVKLRDHVLEERKEHARRVRLQREQDNLKKLVAEEKYPLAIEQGEAALREFADDFEISRLVEFARNQQAHIEQQRRLKEKSKELADLMARADFDKAIPAAEKALEAFPGHPEFQRVLDEARDKKAEKEKRERVEKQIRSIKAAIERGNLTEAIEMGKQTLVDVKHDTDISRLLQMAEREREMRDAARAREDLMKTAVFMMNESRFDEAQKVLEDVQKTSVFDPRVHSLLEAARTKQVPDDKLQKTVVGQVGVTPEQQYVLQAPGSPVAPPQDETQPAAKAQAPGVEPSAPAPQAPPAAPMKDSASAAPVQPPMQPQVTPPPRVEPPVPVKGKPVVEEPPSRKKDKKGKGAPAVEPPPPPQKAAPVVEEPKKPLVEEPKKPAVEPVKAKPAVEEPKKEEPKKPAPPAVAPPPPPVKAKPVEAPPEREKPTPAPAPSPAPKKAPEISAPVVAGEKPVWQNPIVMGIAGLVVVAAIGYFVMKGPSTDPGTGTTPTTTTGTATSGPSAQETQLQAQAKQAWESRRLDDAINGYRQLVGLNGALKTEAQAELDRITALRDNENRLFTEGQQAMNAKQWDAAIAKYNEAAKLDGARKNEASQQVRLATDFKAGRDPASVERDTFNRASTALQRGDYEGARNGFRQVMQMNVPNSTLKSQAQSKLQEAEGKLAQVATEQKAFGDATALYTAGNLQAAKAKFEEVVRLNGANRNAAQQQIREIEAAMDRAGQVATLTQQAEGFITAGRLGEARARANSIGQAGGDASALTSRINQAEQQRFDQAVRDFNAARNNEARLRELQTEFRTINGWGGPSASQARNYAETEIPAAIESARGASVASAKAKAEQAEDAAWSEADRELNQAIQAKNVAGVNAVRPKFEAIQRGGGRHASKAQSVLATRIPEALNTLRPCPPIRVGPAPPSGMQQTYKQGDPVPAALLENAATMSWISCPLPPGFSGSAALLVYLNEDGSVSDVRARANAADPAVVAAVAAVKNWKATPPRYKGNVPVKTNFGIDIR